VWAVLGRRIAPAKAIADDVEDAADDPLVVEPRHSVREREVGRDPLDLRLRQPEQVSMAAPPAAMEAQQDQSARSLLIGPEPR